MLFTLVALNSIVDFFFLLAKCLVFVSLFSRWFFFFFFFLLCYWFYWISFNVISFKISMFALKSTGFILFLLLLGLPLLHNTKLIPGFVFFLLGSSIFFLFIFIAYLISYNSVAVITRLCNYLYCKGFALLWLCLKYFASACFLFFYPQKWLCESWPFRKLVVTVKIPCFYLQFFFVCFIHSVKMCFCFVHYCVNISTIVTIVCFTFTH